jgi:hypothetical protein
VRRPRADGDPVPDVLGMRLAHHAVLRGANRLTDLAERLAAGTCDAKRADAVELSDDHAALDPALNRRRAAADAFPSVLTRTPPPPSPPGRRAARRPHIGDEEASVFPVIERHVSVADQPAATTEERATIQAHGGVGAEAAARRPGTAVPTPGEDGLLRLVLHRRGPSR